MQVEVETVGTVQESIPADEREKVQQLIDSYKGLVFSEDKIGSVNMSPIHLEVDPNYVPPQPQFHNTPIHYQEQLSDHLQFLRDQKAMIDIDPSDSQTYDCVMNTVITDKKDDQIRMNLDTTPWNPGMKRQSSMYKLHRRFDTSYRRRKYLPRWIWVGSITNFQLMKRPRTDQYSRPTRGSTGWKCCTSDQQHRAASSTTQ